MYNIGYLHSTSIYGAQDYKAAFNWFTKAADKENAAAMYQLGWIYELGNGIKKDYKEAVTWYFKATEKEMQMQCSGLGICITSESLLKKIIARLLNGTQWL